MSCFHRLGESGLLYDTRYLAHPDRERILFADLFPLIAFGGAYYFYDIYAATAALMVAMTLLVGYRAIRHHKVDRILLISYLLILVFGGLTLALQDKIFLQLKPTIFTWLIAIVLVGGELLGKRNLLAYLATGANSKFQLPDQVWKRLSLGWAGGMFLKGALNLYFAFYQSEAVWVTFKIAGQFGISMLYIILTLIYLRSYLFEAQNASDLAESRAGNDKVVD